jgi:hypothetical protein
MEPPLSREVLISRIETLFPPTLAPTVEGGVWLVTDGVVRLSLGSKDGLVPGRTVVAFREGRVLLHPRTATVLGRTEQPVGRIVIDHVSEATATGRVVQGLADVRAGDRVRVQVPGGRIQLRIISLIEGVQDAPTKAALLGLVESLNATQRFEISMGEALVAVLLQEGLQQHQILEGGGLARLAKRFDVEHVLVVYARSIDGKPYIDARGFWLSNDLLRLRLLWPGPPCTSLTGDVMSQARFEASQRACDRGDAHGCRDLGALYEQSVAEARVWSGQRSLGLASEFYRLGCEGGDGVGCRNLGTMYRRGRGVSKGPGRAAEFYGRGCDLGDAEACADLAQMHESGTHVSADAIRVRDLYRRACALGALEACGP